MCTHSNNSSWLSGDARYVHALDSLRTSYSVQQKADSTSRTAAQRLLNTLGWVAATEGQKLYINLRESCLIPINFPQLKVTIDQIVQDGRMKFRITGIILPSVWFELHTLCALSLPTTRS